MRNQSAADRPLNNEKGFTLIELIMVIVILGILAAVAVPKFVDLRGDATTAVKDGVTGAIKSTIMMLNGKYLINNASTFNLASIFTNMDAGDVSLANPSTTTLTANIKGTTCTWTFVVTTTGYQTTVGTPTCS